VSEETGLHKEEIRNLYSSPNIMQSSKMRRPGHMYTMLRIMPFEIWVGKLKYTYGRKRS
jgi:hypothetical protein